MTLRLKSRLIVWIWKQTGAVDYMDYLEEQACLAKVALTKLRYELATKDFEAFREKGIEAWPEEQKAYDELDAARQDYYEALDELLEVQRR